MTIPAEPELEFGVVEENDPPPHPVFKFGKLFIPGNAAGIGDP